MLPVSRNGIDCAWHTEIDATVDATQATVAQTTENLEPLVKRLRITICILNYFIVKFAAGVSTWLVDLSVTFIFKEYIPGSRL
jgi:hypothetical protein